MRHRVSKTCPSLLENRSFDHLLGFSAITGTDAVSGNHRSIDGLQGTETNTYQGKSYPVTYPADYAMPTDPGHEFSDVLVQLAGENAQRRIAHAKSVLTKADARDYLHEVERRLIDSPSAPS
jgi:phospholipase C